MNETETTPSEGTPLTVEDLDRHAVKMTELGLELGQFEVRLRGATDVAFRSQRLARTGIKLMGVGIVLAVAAILLGIGAWLGVKATNDSRTDARLGGCFGDNRILDRVREGIVEAGSSAIRTFAPDPNNLTPDQQLIYDNYRNALIVTVTEIVRDRDCSRQGIEDFFNGIDPSPEAAGA